MVPEWEQTYLKKESCNLCKLNIYFSLKQIKLQQFQDHLGIGNVYQNVK